MTPRPAKSKLRRFTVLWKSAVIWHVDAPDEVEALRLAENVTGWPGEALEIREVAA